MLFSDEDDDIEGDIKMSSLKGSKPASKASTSTANSKNGKVAYADNNDDEEDSYFTTVRGDSGKVNDSQSLEVLC